MNSLPPVQVSRQEEGLFFLERKNQRTFVPGVQSVDEARSPMGKSLFASFSSEKEDSCLLFLQARTTALKEGA